MKSDRNTDKTISNAIEVFVRLGFLALLIAWCFQLVYPFAGVIMWSIILALATAPMYDVLNKKLGDKPKFSAVIIILIGLLLVLIPSGLFVGSVVEGAKALKENLDNQTLTVPPPDASVADWPLIGQKLYDSWNLASNNLESAVLKYRDQISAIAEKLLKEAVNIGGSILQFVLATIIAGVLLATKGTQDFTRKFFSRLVGEKSDEYAELATRTVSNVTKGVLGVALIQSILIGLGFLLAGVPYAGIWALLVFVLAILQLPATFVVLPVVVYLFSVLGLVPAILWTVYLFLAGLSDNVLKPILLGKGAPVPMLVIFLGVVGGFMLSGFIGLFTGAIVLSLGYKLFLAWLNADESKTPIKSERRM
jgi:predicted PurR-regulated permease PerM